MTSVTVGKEAISLAEPADLVVNRLGKDEGEAFPLYPDSKIVRWRFPERGIDLLAKDKILVIFLTSAKAPPVMLQQRGVGSDKSELKVGMSEEAAKYLLKGEHTDHMQRFIADTSVGYHFYPELGIAIRYDQKRVAEIAVAQLPRAMFGVK